MIKIMFVCHGNICRSPMAEFVMRDLLEKEGLSDSVYVSSSATSREEIGNPVHPGTRKKLLEYGISTEGKFAIQFTKTDYDIYNYIVVMDSYNLINLQRIIKNDPFDKVYKLLDFSDGGDIADPWYTNDFNTTYSDILKGCKGLLKIIKKDLI